MPEAHQPLAAVEQVLHVGLDGIRGGRRIEHRQHARRGATVQRARERADGRGERRGAVGAGRGHDPRGEGGRVEPVLGRADPVRVERGHVPGIGLAAPLEQEALGGDLAPFHHRAVDRPRVAVAETRRLRSDGEHQGGDASEVLARLVVGDVDQLVERPVRTEARRHRLQVGRRVACQVGCGVRLRRRQPGLRRLVHEEAPHLLEVHVADELLDVDAAVAERSTVAIGLRDLRLEGHDALESRLEIAHRSPFPLGANRLLPRDGT